ncbi:hypothetical protein ACVIWV_006254 [Bradyrhizobium diazoefficiens]
MTPMMIAALGLLMVATAFLSGLFGMAGGLILIGVLLALMPLPTAMVLHAITQDGLERLACVPVAGAYPLASGRELYGRRDHRARGLVAHPLRA